MFLWRTRSWAADRQQGREFYVDGCVVPPQQMRRIPPPSYAPGAPCERFDKDPMAQSAQRFGWWSLKASLIRSAAAAFSPRGEP
ncbi:hypothetical protein VARIO8X_100181 [Burkholderiales bacterium 8X]|nr:hypothetical protein VARIO8X_100181 [Burkholderiales bacterium 8X]